MTLLHFVFGEGMFIAHGRGGQDQPDSPGVIILRDVFHRERIPIHRHLAIGFDEDHVVEGFAADFFRDADLFDNVGQRRINAVDLVRVLPGIAHLQVFLETDHGLARFGAVADVFIARVFDLGRGVDHRGVDGEHVAVLLGHFGGVGLSAFDLIRPCVADGERVVI